MEPGCGQQHSGQTRTSDVGSQGTLGAGVKCRDRATIAHIWHFHFSSFVSRAK